MNKLIKELAIKAGAHWNHEDFNMGSSVEFQQDDLEKFAELIVKECINQCLYSSDSCRIEEHFGVKV